MAGTWVNGGLDYADTVPVDTDIQNWKVALYSNNHTPTTGDVLGTYTLILTGGIVTLTPGWTVGAAASGTKQFTSNLMNFICTASTGASAYGYVVLDPSGSILIAAELFAGGPYPMTAAGEGVQLTVNLKDTTP